MIGLSGAHRTGKTTLAKAYAEKYETPLCLTTASGIFKQLGYDPQENYPIEVRMDIQEAILKSFAEQYKQAGRVFIADRTPIDLMAYTLADITRDKLSGKLEKRLEAYVRDCYALCNKTFATLIVIKPGIKLVKDATKAPIGFGYIEHISQLVMGLTVDERIEAMHVYIPKSITDLKDRVACVRNTVNSAMDKAGTKYHLSANEEGVLRLH